MIRPVFSNGLTGTPDANDGRAGRSSQKIVVRDRVNKLKRSHVNLRFTTNEDG